jgi:hypothetical protein
LVTGKWRVKIELKIGSWGFSGDLDGVIVKFNPNDAYEWNSLFNISWM